MVTFHYTESVFDFRIPIYLLRTGKINNEFYFLSQAIIDFCRKGTFQINVCGQVWLPSFGACPDGIDEWLR